MTCQPWRRCSCGTWGLVGVELDAPVLTGESRAASFTNEGGVDGRVRYLRDIMGLWLVQARAAGRVGGDLEALRALVRQTQEVRRHRPAR